MANYRSTVAGMIETKNLTKLFGDKTALENLSIRIEPGTIFGFLGPNGAGKSTTVKILTGLLRPTRGTAVVAGFDVTEQPLEVKKRLGYVPETGLAALVYFLETALKRRVRRITTAMEYQE
jgi:ABC-type multidrug transport system ATPase subunit